mmetsp:Transcript_73474/g.190826  ORF Transcript_73474/g.190826 Transcript_73474/m.190826 type:complete len:248 (+) Transcript_73474:72-815(+)
MVMCCDTYNLDASFSGYLWKKKHGESGCCDAVLGRLKWNRRHVVLTKGYMYWAVSPAFVDNGFIYPLLCGRVHLGCTPCEAIAVESSTTQFMLRPLEGHVWPREDVYVSFLKSRRSRAEPYIFDTKGSERSRAEWLKHFADHIAQAHATAVRVVSPDCQAWACSREKCSICLEELDARGIDGAYSDESNGGSGTGLVQVAACGHTFHRVCLEKWLRQGSPTCPNCRQPLSSTLFPPMRLPDAVASTQ